MGLLSRGMGRGSKHYKGKCQFRTKGPSNIYYLPALHVASSPSPPMFDSTLPSSVPPPSDPFIKKERIEAKQMVELESEEAKVEEWPKGKGNGKEKKTDE